MTYGLAIYDWKGNTILTGAKMIQAWGNSMIDNIDTTNPVLLRFKFPDNTLELVEFRLSLKHEQYRTYSGVEEAANLVTTSTGSGHEHRYNIDSAQASGSMQYESPEPTINFLQGASEHAKHPHTGFDKISTGEFERDHVHETSQNVSASVHGEDHHHRVDDHKHDLAWAIITDWLPEVDVDIKINGNPFMSDVEPGDAANILIPADKFTIPGWNDIEIFTSEGLSRINATYFTQIMAGV